MPRLSNADYLFTCTYLHEIWVQHRSAFGLVATADQRYLHDFFRLSEILTADELLAHRRAVTADRPSLPQCAGRALRHFADPPSLRFKLVGSKRVVVYPIARPQPDLKLMARAIVAWQHRLAADGKTLADLLGEQT